jgi:Effector Associated Constant Component 1
VDDTDEVVVQVLGVEEDDEQDVRQLTAALRSELLRLDVEDVEPVDAADVPEGAKGLETIEGLLRITGAALSGLGSVLGALFQWSRRTERSVTVTIGDKSLTLSSVTPEQQAELIKGFLATLEA